jgi:ABC-type transport system involved in multi-copper enzyme maturation permease subunit
MIGPVLSQELLLGSRRGRQQIFRRVYAGWLILQLLAFYWLYLVESNWLGARMFGGDLDPQAAGEFGSRFTAVLIGQQLLLLLLATPAFTAGAITDEKTRGTLQYLLTADLSPWEIILGKLLGRIAQLAILTLAALPLICFIGVFGGLNLLALVVLFAATAAPLLALGSASLLASVWSKQTRDAVLGVYLCVLAFFMLVSATDNWALFDPLHVLEPAWGSSSDTAEVARRLLGSLLAWGSIGMVCLGLAVWRLRPAYLRQLQGESRPKRLRWWRARRAPVPDEPIRWKERHVEGLAPLAALRRVPRWLGMAVIFLVTLVASAMILWSHLQRDVSFAEWVELLVALKIHEILGLFGPAGKAFQGQSILALLVAALLVGLRCSGAVTGERERQTWEALLLTPLPAQHLIRGKLWGIIGASYPYLLAYALPALVLALLGGWQATFWTVLFLGVTWLAMTFVGAAGLWCSVRAKSSWRSLMGTVLIGYGGGFFLLGIAFPVAGIVFVVILATLALIDWRSGNQYGLVAWWQGSFDIYTICVCLALVLGFLGTTWFFLVDAQKYVADRERTRHWKEQPKSGRRSQARAKRPDSVEQPPVA